MPCSEIYENGLGFVWQLEEEFRKRITESGDAGTVSQELKEKLRKVSLGTKTLMKFKKLSLLKVIIVTA